MQDPAPNEVTLTPLPELPEPVSSFGGAVADGWLYVYSGHTGGAHEHSKDNLSTSFRRLNLQKPGDWESLPSGEPLQGLPLVAYKGKLYRVGGLSARNPADEDEDLHSVATVAMFDPATKSWHELPPLPQARSSHDAIVLDDKLYVVGGWLLAGDDKEWADTALVLDLKQPTTGWTELPAPPFQRRALAVAAARNKIYALGGMTSDDKPSTDANVFDPKTGKWSAVPSIPGKGMNAFGMAAWGHGDDLVITTLDGNLYRLNSAGDAWDSIGKMSLGRFFHRLLPVGDDQLVIVAGANMREGHLASVGIVRVR